MGRAHVGLNLPDTLQHTLGCTTTWGELTLHTQLGVYPLLPYMITSSADVQLPGDTHVKWARIGVACSEAVYVG